MSTWEIRAEAKALHEIWKSGSTPCGADVPAAVTTILILVRRVLALVEIAEAVSEDCGITPEDMRSRLNDHFVALDHKDEDLLYEYILKAKAALAKLEPIYGISSHPAIAQGSALASVNVGVTTVTDPDRERARLDACWAWLAHEPTIRDMDSSLAPANLAAFVREREEKAFQDGLRFVGVEVRMARAAQREKDRQRMIAMFCCGVDADTNSANRLAVERALPPLKLEP